MDDCWVSQTFGDDRSVAAIAISILTVSAYCDAAVEAVLDKAPQTCGAASTAYERIWSS